MASLTTSITRAAGAAVLAALSAAGWAGSTPVADTVATPAAPAPAAVAICQPCHGLDGNAVAPGYPRLAGLAAGYIAKQLADFASGQRAHEVMSGVAAKLTPADIDGLSRYFMGLPRVSEMPADVAAAAAGRDLFIDGNENTGLPGCFGCHGNDGAGTHRAPSLAGQRADYLVRQLRGFREGVRGNDPSGMMKAVAQRISDDEAKALGAFLSAAPLRARTPPGNPLAGDLTRPGPR